MKRKNIGAFYNNKKLCVQPTDEPPEGQFDAFLSIFTYIMSANFKPEIHNPELMTPYELLCYNNNVYLVDLKKGGVQELKKQMKSLDIKKDSKVIYFKPSETTHYKAFYLDRTFDPYDCYQVRGSHGFCQTFAFFLSIGETDGFITVKPKKKVTIKDFENYALNTQLCAMKFFDIVHSDSELMKKFKLDFDELVKDNQLRIQYGIKKGTTCKKFFQDFEIVTKNLDCVKDYIFDLNLKGWGDKEELWLSYNTKIDDSKLSSSSKKTKKKKR